MRTRANKENATASPSKQSPARRHNLTSSGTPLSSRQQAVLQLVTTAAAAAPPPLPPWQGNVFSSANGRTRRR